MLQPHFEKNEPITSVAKEVGIPKQTASSPIQTYNRPAFNRLQKPKRPQRPNMLHPGTRKEL